MFAPEFNPIAFSIGPLAVHWYGLMYLLGFAFFWALGRLRAKDPWRQMTANDVEDILFYGVLGVILGGRLGFCFFYQPEWYLSHPLDIFKVWQGGMSAHGGIIGSILAICAFARIKGKTFLDVADFVAPLAPLGLMFGRIGNFINGELWGRAAGSDVPWAMIFKNSGTLVPRHPSQLYEAFLEGALLRHGLSLDGKALLPAQVEVLNDDELRFVLKEGKKRQIRRMCAAVGFKVLRLKRVRVGRVRLGALPPGKWRYLKDNERF